MRNIKITALLLAVLMVVAAFAGCASKSTVSNLDNKVNDLAGEIEKQENALAGIQESINGLADAINKGSENDDLKDAVEDNKQDIADIKDMLQDLIGTEESKDALDKAIIKAGAEIDALKGDFEDERVHYVAADVAAIRNLFGSAQAKISALKDAAAVEAEMAALKAELAKFSRVDDGLYAFVAELTGNITAESVARVEAAEDALAAAVEFYDDLDLETALTEYAVEDKKVDLVVAIRDLMKLQYDEYPNLVLEAEHLNQKIAKVDFNTTVAEIETLQIEYKNFVKHAKVLSEANIALVTENGKLAELLTSAKNVQYALAALTAAYRANDPEKTWHLPSQHNGVVDAKGDPAYMTPFYDYTTLVASNAQAVINFRGHDNNKDGYADVVEITKIYDAIDAWADEFKEYFEIGDYAFEYVVTTVLNDEYFLAKYEADKALAKAFLADYDVLLDGVFADIKDFAYERLSVSSSYDLAMRYIKNAEDIRAWAKERQDAYNVFIRDLKNPATVNYTKALYARLLEDNFAAMVIAAGLGDFTAVEREYLDTIHNEYFLVNDPKNPAKIVWVSDFDAYTYKNDQGVWVNVPARAVVPTIAKPAALDFATATDDQINDYYKDLYFFDLYAFDFAIRSNDLNFGQTGSGMIVAPDAGVADNTVGWFARDVIPYAKEDADALNKKIVDFREYEQQSIAGLVVNIGGYHNEVTPDYNDSALNAGSVHKKLTAIDRCDYVVNGIATNPYAAGTIADFYFNYQNSKCDLSKMLNLDLYTQKLETIEKNVEEGYKALKALMEAYYAIRGDYNNVLVTTKNADAIIALEPLLVKVVKLSAHNMQIATLTGISAENIREYDLEFIVADYIPTIVGVDLNDAMDFYVEYLLATDYTDTHIDTVDTGLFIRLIYKARTLLAEEANVVKGYTYINNLNKKAFSFAELNDLPALVKKLAGGSYANLSTYGYHHGITSAEATSINNGQYNVTVKGIAFDASKGGFCDKTVTYTVAATSTDAALKAAATSFSGAVAFDAYNKNDIEKIYNLLFVDTDTQVNEIKAVIAETDFEELGLTALNGKFIPAYLLPFLTIYFEAKFNVNNAGIVSEKIEAAKNGFGEPGKLGFDYIKALVVNQLRYIDAHVANDGINSLNSIRVSALGECADYNELSIALLQADEYDFQNKIESIIFVDVDYTWLSETYDLRGDDHYQSASNAIGTKFEAIDANAYDEYVLADGTAFLDSLDGLDKFVIYSQNNDWEQAQ